MKNPLELRCISGLHLLKQRGSCNKCRGIRRKIWNSENPIEEQSKFNLAMQHELEKAAIFVRHREYLAIQVLKEKAKEEEKISEINIRKSISKKRSLGQNNRAKKLGIEGILSPDLTHRLFFIQNGKCACCNKPLGKNFELDHILPLSKGGLNTDDNIQLLRQRCNSVKKAKNPVNFMREQGFLI